LSRSANGAERESTRVHAGEPQRADCVAHRGAEADALGELVEVRGGRRDLERFVEQLVDQRLLCELVEQREAARCQIRSHELERERAHGRDLEAEPSAPMAGERAQDLAPLAARRGDEERAGPRGGATRLVGEGGEQAVGEGLRVRHRQNLTRRRKR
jgi:hypothetical protein